MTKADPEHSVQLTELELKALAEMATDLLKGLPSYVGGHQLEYIQALRSGRDKLVKTMIDVEMASELLRELALASTVAPEPDICEVCATEITEGQPTVVDQANGVRIHAECAKDHVQ